MDRSLDKLKSILKQHIGLDASTVGDATIKKILNQRMRSCGVQTDEEYLEQVAQEPQELGALLETAIIPETWFFRDSKAFSIILQRLQQHILKTPRQVFNILSIPCSTGEEPCSLAMFLLESGIPAGCFNIDAVDISNNSLQIARQGVYGENSFRGRTEQRYLEKYFSRQDELYIIDDRVRQTINFRQVNILDNNQLPCQQCYDAILCRNLLIYFDVDTKKAAFMNLHRILKDDGILFIGHSEFGAVPDSLFVTRNIDNIFGLVKPGAEEPNRSMPAATKTVASAPQPGRDRRQARASPRAFSSPRYSAENAQDIQPSAENQDLLERARELADAGSLQSAEDLCLQHMELEGDSAEAFFMLGLIRQASNDPDMAESMFRKALYLNPGHYDSLVYLALIVDQSGDSEAAELLRQRARRAQEND